MTDNETEVPHFNAVYSKYREVRPPCAEGRSTSGRLSREAAHCRSCHPLHRIRH
jgi:hypothetical protein